MPAIRVLLGDMTPMFGSLVAGYLTGCDGVELSPARAGVGFAERMAQERFDVVLLRAPDVIDSSGVLASLARSAPMGVVAIGDSGQSGFAYRVEAMPILRNPAGRLELMAAIRMAAGRPTPDRSIVAGRA